MGMMFASFQHIFRILMYTSYSGVSVGMNDMLKLFIIDGLLPLAVKDVFQAKCMTVEAFVMTCLSSDQAFAVV